jgi:hypothetical protein
MRFDGNLRWTLAIILAFAACDSDGQGGGEYAGEGAVNGVAPTFGTVRAALFHQVTDPITLESRIKVVISTDPNECSIRTSSDARSCGTSTILDLDVTNATVGADTDGNYSMVNSSRSCTSTGDGGGLAGFSNVIGEGAATMRLDALDETQAIGVFSDGQGVSGTFVAVPCQLL